MDNYFQCPTCGSPNESNLKCTYCGNVFVDKKKLLYSKTNKGLFDLAIYAYNDTDYDKAIDLFEKIITKDSENKIAWFYKYISEFLNSSYSKIDDLIVKIKPYKNISIFEEKFSFVLEKSLIYKSSSLYPYQDINTYDIVELHNFLNELSDFSKNKVIDIYAKRHQWYVHKHEDSAWDTSLFNEIISLFKIKFLKNSDINISEKYIKTIKDLVFSRCQYFKKEKEDAQEFIYSKNNPYWNREQVLQANTLRNQKISDLNLLIEKTENFINELLIQFNKENIESLEIKEIKTTLSDIGQLKIDTNYTNKKNSFEIKSKGCFIATATMGSYDHPVVMDLRLFRDNWLLNKSWGIKFTSWYYTHGPKAARVIEKSNILKKLCYWIIIKPIHIITKFYN